MPSTPCVRIISLTRVPSQTASGYTLSISLNNGSTIENAQMADICTPFAFGELLKKRGINAVPVCAGTTTTEKQKYWNTQLKPIVQTTTTAVPRWRDESYWKNAG